MTSYLILDIYGNRMGGMGAMGAMGGMNTMGAMGGAGAMGTRVGQPMGTGRQILSFILPPNL